MKKILFAFLGLFIFSGCSFFETEEEKVPTYVELEGTVMLEKKDVFSLSQYFLLDGEQKKIARLDSVFEDLENFEDKNVVLKGKKMSVDEDTPELLSLEVVQISKVIPDPEVFSIPFLGTSLLLPDGFLGAVKKEKGIVNKDGESFLTISEQRNQDWQKRFRSEGEKIIIKDFEVFRLFSGQRIQLFFTEQEIQIDFWGKEDEYYEFYSLLDSLLFFEKIENVAEEDEFEFEKVEKTQASTDEFIRQEKNDENNKEERGDVNATSSKVVEAVEKKIDELLGNEEKKIKTISLYKNFVDVEIFSLEKKQRFVFSYRLEELTEDVLLEEVARYKEGKVKSWELESGETPLLAGDSEIFLRDIDDEKAIVLPERFALYISSHFDFQVGYPRNFYYRATGKTEEFLAQVEWSLSPVSADNAQITLQIIAGKKEGESFDKDSGVFLFPRDEKTHFKLFALPGSIEIAQQMRDLFRSTL